MSVYMLDVMQYQMLIVHKEMCVLYGGNMTAVFLANQTPVTEILHTVVD